MSLAIEAISLTRVYPSSGPNSAPRAALTDLDLTVESGEVHGLLGPNGAGKTTLCRILSTVLLPTSGTARVDGLDVVRDAKKVKSLVGIVFGGERGLYTRLTARQNLRYWAALYRVPRAQNRVEELLDRVGLIDRADERVETFSRGMKQRLHLARGLVGDPRVLILDEPTTGMDPVAAHEFRALVHAIRAEGRSVLVTTHDMAEAESICDRVSLIDSGRLLRTEDPKTIGRWLNAYGRIDAQDVPRDAIQALHTMPDIGTVTTTGPGGVRVQLLSEAAAGEVLRLLVSAGVTSIVTGVPSLEEVYLDIIGSRGMSV